MSTLKPMISLQERFEYGNFSIAEVCALSNRSRSRFYADLKAGLVLIHKLGRRSMVPGPIAKKYIDGAPQKSS